MLGQACIAIRAGDAEIACDPWVLRRAQLGSWLPYPPRTPARVRAQVARVDAATHVYLSHDHADHFDPALLARLRPKTLVVSRFRNAGFRRALLALVDRGGHRLVELERSQALEVAPGVSLRVIPEQPRFRTNSILLLDTPVGAVLNANDCSLNSAVLGGIAARRRVRLFLYTLNFMANGFPFPYLTRGDPRLMERITEVRDQIVQTFRLALETLRPELAVAFAGPVTFADAVNGHLNAHPEALDWRAMVRELCATAPVAWPTPGSRITIDEHAVRLTEPASWEQVWAAEPPPPATRHVVDDAPMPRERVERAAAAALRRLTSALARAGRRVDQPLVLSCAAGFDALEDAGYRWTLRIDLDPPGGFAWLSPGVLPDRYLHVVSTARVLVGFLEGRVCLDELLLSALARFARRPDGFNNTLHGFLRLGHDPEATAALVAWHREQARTRATFTCQAGGRSFVIPKFCPHEGESLEHGVIEDGCIVCPRHKWKFDLQSGRCVAVGDPALNLYPQAEDAA
jgi:UDP-MurNAc hydroxylase